MRVMLDTNILISALVFGGKAELLLTELFLSECEVYVSEYVTGEFAEKIALKWPQKAEQLMDIYTKLPVIFCKSTDNMQGSLRDNKDLPVLSDALYHNADVILTGDKDFLEAEIDHPMIFSISMMSEYIQKINRMKK
ncbi:MAG: putative toxin-antitoxin system toxin component, PIN family [Eubacterium sp.]|nr:putative toxin-antitoxin system toxin component, PIN family [Eubacterium sp.]